VGIGRIFAAIGIDDIALIIDDAAKELRGELILLIIGDEQLSTDRHPQSAKQFAVLPNGLYESKITAA